MAKKNFYAIKTGLVPGIYTSWDEAKKNVDGYPNAVYKGFATYEEAMDFMGGDAQTNSSDYDLPYAFVDGSYNSQTGVYGCGGFLVDCDGVRHPIQDSDNDPELSSMHNVAGEILGSTLAVKMAIKLGLSKLTVYYDYEGIAKWATKEWKRNKAGTIAYADFIDSVSDRIELSFIHVKGHSGVPGNEEADRMAKEAVGI